MHFSNIPVILIFPLVIEVKLKSSYLQSNNVFTDHTVVIRIGRISNIIRLEICKLEIIIMYVYVCRYSGAVGSGSRFIATAAGYEFDPLIGPKKCT